MAVKTKKTAKKPLKDPKGGLTAAGREHFANTEGARLQPGVKKVETPEDMKRKGSFLRRHYGKKTISPLVDGQGKPTRYAKQAHAWGEPIPKTKAAVERLAKKGTALLDKYHQSQDAAKPSKTAAKRRSTKG